MLAKTSACVKCFNVEIKWIYFFGEDDKLLEKYNRIWNKFSNSIKRELACEPIYNKKFLKTKIRSYADGATDFQLYLFISNINQFFLKKDENYYLEAFLKECKYTEKVKK